MIQYVRKNILGQTDDDIKEIDKQIAGEVEDDEDFDMDDESSPEESSPEPKEEE